MIALALFACAVEGGRDEDASCYDVNRSMEDVATRADELEGELVTTCATFTELAWAADACEAVGGDDPQWIDEYATYDQATWGMTEGGWTVAVVVLAQDGETRLDDLPDTDLLEPMTGTIRYAEVTDRCDLDVVRYSAFIELNAAEGGIDGSI